MLRPTIFGVMALMTSYGMTAFELPLLFFVVVGFLFGINGVSILELAVAWLFVLSRLVHTFAALSGQLLLRHVSFLAGFVLVFFLWLDLAVRIL